MVSAQVEEKLSRTKGYRMKNSFLSVQRKLLLMVMGNFFWKFLCINRSKLYQQFWPLVLVKNMQCIKNCLHMVQILSSVPTKEIAPKTKS